MKQKKFNNQKVATVFTSYPKEFRTKLMFLRQLIFDTAAKTKGVGEIEETLKWGEPSYLTQKSKSGSTIRINWKESLGDKYAIYFKCTSTLIPTFKEIYPKDFTYEGNRAIIFKQNEKIPIKKLRHCIELALTYHLRKKSLKR
ncbi:MAG: DUF1801 domain-containing protein [Nanoarchaeota archaeon]